MTQLNQELIPQIFKKTFVSQVKEKLVFGSVANMDLEANIKQEGDEVDIPIRPRPTYSSWTGGDLSARENLKGATTKLKILHGGQVHFSMNPLDQAQAMKDPERLKYYTQDTNYLFANDMDEKFANLYQEAGVLLTQGYDGSTAININSSNALKVMIEAQKKMKEQSGLDNSAVGNMFWIAPPAFYAHVMVDGRPFYTDAARQEIGKNGKFGTKLIGLDVMESNNCYNSSGTYYMYFGVKEKCLAGAVQKDMSLKAYNPELAPPDEIAYKGAGLFGVGCYDSRFFGVVKCTFASLI